MLVLNTLGRNRWSISVRDCDFYNNLTGILSDVLSYIRLFAIGPRRHPRHGLQRLGTGSEPLISRS